MRTLCVFGCMAFAMGQTMTDPANNMTDPMKPPMNNTGNMNGSHPINGTDPMKPPMNGTDPWNPPMNGSNPMNGTHGMNGTDPMKPPMNVTNPMNGSHPINGTDPMKPPMNGTDPKNPPMNGSHPINGTNGMNGTGPMPPMMNGSHPMNSTNGMNGTDPWNPPMNGSHPMNGTDPMKPPMNSTDPKNPPMNGSHPMNGTDPMKPPMNGTDPKNPPMNGSHPINGTDPMKPPMNGTDNMKPPTDNTRPERMACTGPQSEWMEEEREKCCEDKKIGCGEKPQFECKHEANTTDVTQWTEEQKDFCCQRDMIACGSNAFNCSWGGETQRPWSGAQRDWCCTEKGVNCQSENEKKEDKDREQCRKDEMDGVLAKDADKSQKCCKDFAYGCVAKFECFANQTNASEWAEEKKEFCCREKDAGCAMRCDSKDKDMLTGDQQEFCCSIKGMGCSSEFKRAQKETDEKKDKEERDAGVHKKGFQMKLKGDAEEIFAEPKVVLRRLRKALLEASEKLGEKPERLVVKLLGLLMPNGKVPEGNQTQNWTMDIPRSWNEECHADEKERHAKNATQSADEPARDAGVLGETDSDYYAEIEIQDTDAATVEAASTEVKTTADNGALGGGDGPELAVGDMTEMSGSAPSTTPTTGDDDDSSSKTWLWALIGAVGALCIGAGVAAVMVHRKKETTNQGITFQEMEGQDDMSYTKSDVPEFA